MGEVVDQSVMGEVVDQSVMGEVVDQSVMGGGCGSVCDGGRLWISL